MAQKKRILIKRMLKRHEEFFDQKVGESVSNDFMQLSQILEELKSIGDKRAFHAFFSVISENCHLKEVIAGKLSRIALEKDAKTRAEQQRISKPQDRAE